MAVDKILKDSIAKLENWISLQGYKSYDSHDLQATKLGIIAKKFYNKRSFLKYPIFGPLYLFDIFIPRCRNFFSQKEISAEALPYFARGYFRLYELTKEKIYLEKALKCLDLLFNMRVETASGIGWGLHFNWPSLTLIPKNTPCITVTANAIDSFLEAYRITQNKKYLEITKKAADFALHDLNRKLAERDTLAVSYTPICNRFVINANSYCAKMLYDASWFLGDETYRNFADRILRYILQQQNEDGSWFYRDKDQMHNNFIDNLHTCFVLEHLYSIFLKNNRDERIKIALEKGHHFFIKAFINPDYSCRHFYRYPHSSGVKVDIRSCAETIYYCALVSNLFSDGSNIAKNVANWTIRNMQDGKGFFYFRSYSIFKNKMPYMRWAQAPMFNALTYLLKKLENN